MRVGVSFDGVVTIMGGKYAVMVCDACENVDSKVDIIREMWLCHVWEKVGSWWWKYCSGFSGMR